MCLIKNEDLIKELQFQDGMFDHVDIMQQLSFLATKTASDAANDSGVDSETKTDALFNLENLAKAMAYISIVHHHILESMKGDVIS